jgi:AraC family transcriptional regulator
VLRIRHVFDTALMRIERIDHPPDVDHVDPDEEMSQQYSVNLLEHGTFSIYDGSRVSRVTTAEYFLTTPGKVHRYGHDEHDCAPTDVCVAVCFTDTARDEVRALVGSLQDCLAVVPLNNRRGYVRNRLFAHLAASDDSLALDVIAAELLAAAIETREGHLYRPSQLSWYGRRVDAVRRRLEEEFASDHSLTQLARDAGMSPYHFARVFRELTGMPPHRFLLRRRLAAAAQQLREGASVTDTSFAVGFRSLSHFIHVFRRHFGVSPSRIGQARRPPQPELPD